MEIKNQKVNTCTVTNGQKIEHDAVPVLNYIAMFPEFSPVCGRGTLGGINSFYRARAARFVSASQALLADAVRDYQNSICQGFPPHMYEADLNHTVTLNEGCVLSLFADRYEYTGGAHGSTQRCSESWNTAAGRRLCLAELFPGQSGFEDMIKAEIIRQIDERLKENPSSYFDDYPELVAETFSCDSFYLTPDGIIIYFQQYDIAPYSTGLPEFLIPYGRLGSELPSCC